MTDSGSIGQNVSQAQDMQQGLSQVTQQAQSSAGGLAEQAKQQITQQLTSQKDRASTSIESVAQAIREAGQQLEQQGPAPVVQYANQAADQVERVSHYLGSKDISELQADVAQFARSQPVVFLAGAFALGWLGARFFKSSPPAQQGSQYGSGFTPSTTSRTGAGTYGGA